MSQSEPFDLFSTYLRMRADASVESLPVDETFWERIAAGELGTFQSEHLVSCYSFDTAWPVWEMHPKGAELVVCTDGALTIHQEIGGAVRTVSLRKGEAVVNPPGVWHTADCDGPCTALFITAGEGTEHRPRG